MKTSFLRAPKSRKVALVTKIVGLLSFIILCVVCLVSPIITLAGSNLNTVVFVKDYGNISQFVVMPNGQLSMKPKVNSILHAINRRFVSATATDTSGACATLDALTTTDGSPDPLGGSPDSLDGSPDSLDGSPDALDNATCLSLLADANSNSNLDSLSSPDNLGCSDGLNLTGSPDTLDGSPDPLGTCTNGMTRVNQKLQLNAPNQMPLGEIIAVQSGKDVVVAIFLGHNQVLMSNGTTMNLA